MDFHAAMETFAEAWVAANTQTAVNSDPQVLKQTSVEDLPTLLPKEQLVERSQGGGNSAATSGSGPSLKESKPEESSSPKKPEGPAPTVAGSGKSLPIHCLVEQVAGIPTFKGVTSSACSGNSVELDSYAILPCSTLLCDLVRAALLKLGYTSVDAMHAKGAIQIKNWKPLTFEAITDNPQASIDDILSELTSVATLRIRLASPPKLNTAADIKDKLLQLLLSHSQGLLNEVGCPIEKTLLTSLSRGEKLDSVSEEMLTSFDKWYKDQLTLRQRQPPPLSEKSVDIEKTEPNKPSSPVSTLEPKENHASALFNHCRTRIRTSFDPEHEIPRLQKWFQDNQHPSREQMIVFMNELNSLDSRKGRRPLDLTNIIYWFKNARAAQRRASKAMDDSFENDENGDLPSSTFPYLPNKNAVYMIPFPFNSQMMTSDGSCDEPCDLSVAKRRDEEPEDAQEKTSPVRDSVVKSNENGNGNGSSSPYEIGVKHELPDTCNGEKDHEVKVEAHSFSSTDGPTQNGFDNDKEEFGSYNNNNNNNHLNGDEENSKDYNDMEEMDDEDYESSESDRSVSGDEPVSMIKKEGDKELDYRNSLLPVSVSNSSAANMAALSLAQMAQPLHVPQLPPPLMTYYPVNARFYSPQSNSVPHGPLPHPSPQRHHESRKRRTRVFIDPLTEIPKLEKWFLEDTHPSAYMIDKFCEELNRSDYRQKFPRLEAKNVQLWFKNHRAKVKRMRLSS